MDAARISELLVPFLGSSQNQAGISEELVSHISTYINILLRWNSRVNLTAIRDPEEIVTRHFGESLFAARHLFPKSKLAGGPLNPEFGLSGDSHTDTSAKRHGGRAALQRREQAHAEGALAPVVADIGSGAGFPGIPIKLWVPDLLVTLIESNHKKATFLREITRALTLTDINIQNARAETLPPASFDIVTLRAVERFESILPVAARLVTLHGRLALLVGSSQLEQARQLEPSLSWQEPVAIPGSHSRAVVIAQRNHDDMNQHEQ